MNNKRVLITGGAGFIGSHLTRHLLKQAWEVVVLDNCSAGNKLEGLMLPRLQFLEADIRDERAVKTAAKGCTHIVHLAALVGVDEVIRAPTATIEIEVTGMQHIARAARENKVTKLIYASSSAVYKNTINSQSQECDPLQLVNEYAVAKRLNELYLESMTAELGISTNSLRLFNVYGARQDTRMVIPRFFEQARRGQAIQVFGDGSQTRDFTQVNEVVLAIEKLLEQPEVSGIFNVAQGTEVSILELAETIKSVTQSNSQIVCLDFPEERLVYKVNRRVGSPEKLWEATGFRPRIALREGLLQQARHLQCHTSTIATI